MDLVPGEVRAVMRRLEELDSSDRLRGTLHVQRVRAVRPDVPLIVAALRPGGLLVADNLTSHAEDLAGFREQALGHARLTGLVVPVGRGELVAVKSSPSRER